MPRLPIPLMTRRAATPVRRAAFGTLLAVAAWAAALSVAAPATGQTPLRAQPQAWQYNRYRVHVWVCHDRGSHLAARAAWLVSRVKHECDLRDSSAWEVDVTVPPLPWNVRFESVPIGPDVTPSVIAALGDNPPDKLIVVQLAWDAGQTSVRARELDVRTRTWGPVIEETASQVAQLPAITAGAVAQAFMPLAIVERVTDNDQALVRLRAVNLAIQVVEDEAGQLTAVANHGSPVLLRDNDILMPVIRRLDREGNLSSVDLITWTYLTIRPKELAAAEELVDAESSEAVAEQYISTSDIVASAARASRTGPMSRDEGANRYGLESQVVCDIQSMNRVPLGGRTGRTIERLALVVRPNPRKTWVKLVARDPLGKLPDEPLIGVDVYSRRPGQDQKQASDFLGKTDWRGMLEIPPADPQGLRMLLIKSGQRSLAQLPVLPGLVDVVEAPMPSDQNRLYAEGVINGLQADFIDLLAQRTVLATEIKRLADLKKKEEAQKLLQQYRDLPGADRFLLNVLNEEKGIVSSNPAEMARIQAMFEELRILVGQHLTSNEERELATRIETGRPPESETSGKDEQTEYQEAVEQAAQDAAASEGSTKQDAPADQPDQADDSGGK